MNRIRILKADPASGTGHRNNAEEIILKANLLRKWYPDLQIFNAEQWFHVMPPARGRGALGM
jgi:hypothetical protein